MNEWAKVWVNDPYDDYNLTIEIICDNKDVALIKQSTQGLILKWHISPIGLVIPADWFAKLLQEAKRDIRDPVTVEDDVKIGQWTANWESTPDGNTPILKIFCDSEDIAVIEQSEQELSLKWDADSKKLIIPANWLLEQLIAAKEGMG